MRTIRMLLFLAVGGVLASAEPHQATAVSVGDQTVALYRDLLRRSKPFGWPDKAAWIENEASRYTTEGTFAHPIVIPPGEVPRLVALRAINLEMGGAWPPRKPEKQAIARYPDSVRRRWSPLARRLWLEGTYDSKTSDLSTVRAEIAVLRRLGQNLDALEAHLVGKGKLNAKNGYQIADQILRYAEAHPNDIVAAKSATVILYVPTFLAVDKGQPLRKDLLDRTFALERRTIRNQNALLNDDLTHLKTFDILRDTMNGKYRKP